MERDFLAVEGIEYLFISNIIMIMIRILILLICTSTTFICYSQDDLVRSQSPTIFSEIDSLNKLSFVFAEEGNRDEAILLVDSALKLSQDHDYLFGIVKAYSSKARVFLFGEHIYPDSAVHYFEISYDYAVLLGDEVEIATGLSNRSMASMRAENFSAALDLAFELIEFLKGVKEESTRMGFYFYAYNSIIDIFLVIEEYEKALSYAEKAREVVSGSDLGVLLCNMAYANVELGRYDSAYLQAKAALDLIDQSPIFKIGSLYIAGRSAFEIGLSIEAKKYLTESLRLSTEVNDFYYSVLTASQLGEIALDEKAYEESKVHFQFAIEASEKSGARSERLKALYGLYVLYKALGQFGTSLYYHELHTSLKDSVINEKKIYQLSELETKYETEKKESENKLLTQQAVLKEQTIAQQRLWIVLVVVFLLVVAILLFIQYKSRLTLKKQKIKIESQSNKLQALDQFKSRFFANVSHDLRTPLMLIQGNVQKIENSDSYLDEQSQRSLEKLNIQTKKLTHLTDEIRDLILLEDNRLRLIYQRVTMSDYLQRLIANFHSIAELKQISLNYEDRIGDEAIIHLDTEQFEKVIYNLISNALKFTDPRGEIILILEQKQSDQVQIKVQDNGAGISEDKVQYIFNRFYQATEAINAEDEGIGIGLSLVMEIVQLHGGEIEVESVLGEGTTFIVNLPLNLDKAVSTSKATDSKPAQLYFEEEPFLASQDIRENEKVKANASTILVVDDHPEIREYIKELIDDEYIIRMASDGREALELLQKGKIDLVITDLMMPWMDGYELIDSMKSDEQFKLIPTMVVSARATGEDLMKVLESGVNQFITKPFEPKELKQRIRNALIQKNAVSNLWDEISSDKKKLSEVEQNMISRINTLVLDRIDDSNFSVEDIAELMATSPRNALNLMRKLTDKNPKDYITNIRFQYANDLMMKKKVKSVSEAAQSIGLVNVTHFSKQFEKAMGIQPSSYFDD